MIRTDDLNKLDFVSMPHTVDVHGSMFMAACMAPCAWQHVRQYVPDAPWAWQHVRNGTSVVVGHARRDLTKFEQIYEAFGRANARTCFCTQQ